MGVVFPFQMVEKDSEIIIWGAGVVGKEYVRQIHHTKYCYIKGVVDSTFENSIPNDIRITKTELQNLQYDALIIATIHDDFAKEIIRECNELKIDKDKIIWCPLIASYWDETSSLNIKKISNAIDLFMQLGLGDFEGYFKCVISDISVAPDKHDLKKQLLNEAPLKDVKHLTILLRLFLRAECFDEKLMKIYLHTIAQIEDKELVVCLLYEIVWQEVMHHEYCYNEYYNDRRRLLKDTGRSLVGNYGEEIFENVEIRKKPIEKICIIRLNMPLYQKSEATRLNVHWANELSRMGYEVKILDVTLLEKDVIKVRSFMNFDGCEVSFENREYLDNKVVFYTAQGNSIKKKLLDIVNCVKEFNPDLIVDTCADYEMLSSILYEHYLVFQIPMRGVNSCTFFHKTFLGCEAQYDRENAKYKCIKKEDAVFIARYHKIMLDFVGDAGYEIERNGIRKDAFIIATVGTRVSKEVSKEFVDAVCLFLNKNTNAVWLLVGSKVFPYIEQKYSDLIEKKRIILWGYEYDLDTFYHRLGVKILLLPKVPGNGGCAYKALRSGTCVLINEVDGDIEHLIGRDSMVSGDYDNLLKRVDEYYNDSKLWEDESKRSKRLINELPTARKFCEKIVSVAEDVLEKA